MRTRLLLLVLASTGILIGASVAPAGAGVPSVALSTVDPCLIVCPDGDIPFRVVVRDAAANPMPYSEVTVNWCAAEEVTICYLRVCSFTGLTDAAGIVTFDFKIGGVSAGAVATIYADGVPLATRWVASPDQNGDLIVDPTDVAIANGKLGAADPTMDLDCDLGVVTAADLALQLDHVGHNCDAPIPTVPRSWGQLRITYR